MRAKSPINVAFDAALPLIVVAVVNLAVTLFPDSPLVVLGVVFGPMIAALARASIAYRQFERRGLQPTMARQCAISGAIVILFVFEMFATGGRAAEVVDPLYWLAVAAIYVAYLGAISLAFYQRQQPKAAEPAW